MSHLSHSAELVELYCDFAAHLISIPEIAAISGAVEWLAERMLFGLPDPDSHKKRYVAFFREDGCYARALREFTYPDTKWHTEEDFARFMGYAHQHLRQAGAPPFPRVAELNQRTKGLPQSR